MYIFLKFNLFLYVFSSFLNYSISFGKFPQNLVLELENGPYQINILQILCHEFKIPTSVEIYIGIFIDPNRPYSEENAYFSFLGFAV